MPVGGRSVGQGGVGAGVHFHAHQGDLIGGDVEGQALFHGDRVVGGDAPPDEEQQQESSRGHAVRKAFGAEVLHGKAAGDGADGGAGAVQQQQSAGGFEGFVGGEAVVGLGDGHAVDGEEKMPSRKATAM